MSGAPGSDARGLGSVEGDEYGEPRRSLYASGYDTPSRRRSSRSRPLPRMTDLRCATDRPRFPRATTDVSIALCTRNGERWIGHLLESMAAQSRPADELVVQDDLSTDDTCDIIRSFASTAPFEVRLEVNPVRLGSTANFAAVLERCRGRYVALADQDDRWYRTKLERLIDELEADPTITMVFSDADLIGEDGQPLGRRLWDTRLVGRTLRKRAVVPEELFARRALTTGCTMAVRRRAVAAALPFPSELDDPVSPMRHDRWLSLVAAAVGTVRALPEPLVQFRVHPNQQTGVLIGSKLTNALARAALGTFRSDNDDERGLQVRAGQLEIAAGRADDIGDFEGAETLRSVADHLRRRVSSDQSVSRRLQWVAHDVRSGAYGWDRLGVGAAFGDVIRSLTQRQAHERLAHERQAHERQGRVSRPGGPT